MNDLKFAFRQLLKNPGFTAVAVLTLALGIGANTAIFSVVDTVLLRLLPVERPQELVFLRTTEGTSAPPYPCFERIRDETRSFDGAAAFATDETKVEIDGVIEQVYAQVVSGNYFDVLGLKPAAGRLMIREDEKLNPPVAVIGYGYWQRRFGGTLSAIGRTLTVGDRIYTIVGITRPQFWGLEPGRQVDVTFPISIGPVADTERGWFDAVARLLPGATVEQATVQADAIFQSFMQEHDRLREPAVGRDPVGHVELTSAARGLERLRARFSRPLYALTALGGIVLLIACANLGTLMLVRGATRAREFAIRLAMGANSGRLLRQLLTETLLLFLLGSSAGLVIAYVATQGLTGFFAIGRRPILVDIEYDWRLAAFGTGITLAGGLLTGLCPGLRALRTDPQAALKEGEARLAGSRRTDTVEGLLVATQVALSLVLLVTAAIFVKTIVNLRAIDLGFSGSRVLTMSLKPDFPGGMATGAHEQFRTHVLDRVRALPGIQAASLSVLTPLSGRDTGTLITVRGFQDGPRHSSQSRLGGVLSDIRNRASRRASFHSG